MGNDSPSANTTPLGTPARSDTRRDIRLDVFRGLALCLILLSHAPGNPWAAWTPSRFGFSDATEMFVFLSGMAAAIAIGPVFQRGGWWLGTARVALRLWQIYWVHVGLFVVIAAALAGLDRSGAFDKVYVDTLGLGWFFADPAPYLVGLVTLTWLPNYFDILPMYLVLLALLPAFIALARVDPRLACAASLALWLAAQTGVLALSADPTVAREWFFNPFGWQVLFVAGFALRAGWLPAPSVSRTLICCALAYLVLTTPLSSAHVVGWVQQVWLAGGDWAVAVYPGMEGWRTKTELGLLRVVHFLALAYLAWLLCGAEGARLRAAGQRPVLGRGVAYLARLGQQSLPVFAVSMVLSRAMGVAFDLVPAGPIAATLVNAAGLAGLWGAAAVAGWVKAQPWKRRGSGAAG